MRIFPGMAMAVVLLACAGSDQPEARPGTADSAPPTAGRLAAGTPGDAAESAVRCRCVPRNLGDYWTDAHEVVAGRVVAIAEDEDRWHQLMVVELLEHPWKWDAERSTVLAGDTVRYRTAASSAACGLSASVGEGYLFFGVFSPEEGGLPRVDTCSGSRRFGDAEAAGDFLDVPAGRVHAQLDALSGLDALTRLAASAPDPEDPGNATLVGLVDLPPLTQGGDVAVYESPDSGARVLSRVTSYGELEAWEVGYEVAAAGVLARSGGWYRVRPLEGEPGWVAPDAAGTWFPYPEVVVNRLNYLTEAWSGNVWPDPGAGLPSRSPRKGAGDREEYPAEVLEVVYVAGTPWLRVGILDGSPCFATEVRTELSGWIPAWGEGGRPAAWYYSRGC